MQAKEWLFLLLLCCSAILFGVVKAASMPFWSDELATVHIATAPTWHEMVLRGHEADLNPPLLPILVRLSTACLGPHELGARLPSILSFTGAIAAVFLVLLRRVALPFALFGALLLLCNIEVRYYLTEARPYALLLGAVAVGFWAYDAIVLGRNPPIARVVLGFAMLVMLQAHFFGSVAAASFCAAEVARTVRRRRLDPWTAVALLLPWVSCVTYIPILFPQTHGPTLVYREHDRASWGRGLGYYFKFLVLPLSGVLKFGAVITAGVYLLPKRGFAAKEQAPAAVSAQHVESNTTPSPSGWPAESWVLLMLLGLTPVLVTLAFLLHSPEGGFYPRYAIAATVPAAILLAQGAAWLVRKVPVTGWLFVAAALLVFARGLRDEDWHHRNLLQTGILSQPPGFASTKPVNTVCPSLPLVVNNALDFFQADYRIGPQGERRMIYVTDPVAALALEHENIGESIADMAKAFEIDHAVVPASSFFAQHEDFLLLSRPAGHDWFLDALTKRNVALLSLGDVRFAGMKERFWYVRTDPSQPVANCVAAAQPAL